MEAVMGRALRRAARGVVPAGVRTWLRLVQQRGRWVPPVGRVRFGSLRRLEPVSREYGFDRGTPVDRHYIEEFLARHAADVRGRVLEIKDDGYTRRFGGDRVERSDVLALEADAPGATLVLSLERCLDMALGGNFAIRLGRLEPQRRAEDFVVAGPRAVGLHGQERDQ